MNTQNRFNREIIKYKILKHIKKINEKYVMGKVIFHEIINKKNVCILWTNCNDVKVTFIIEEDVYITDDIITEVFSVKEILEAILQKYN